MDSMNDEKLETRINKFKTSFHALLLVHHLYAVIYTNESVDFSAGNIEVLDLQTFRYRFVTTWNMVAQCIYLFIALYTDVVRLRGSTKENKLFERVEAMRSYAFTTFVFPLGFFVSSFFWFMFNLDRELIYPQHFDSIIPIWLNHCVHTSITLLPTVEIFFQKEMPSFRASFKGMTILSVFYYTTYYFTYYQSSRWLYKVFNVLNWPERIALSVFLYVFSVFLLWLGVTIQKCLISKKYQRLLMNKNALRKTMIGELPLEKRKLSKP